MTYEEGPGAHNFTFWNAYLARVLDWRPLEEPAEGISGNHVRRN